MNIPTAFIHLFYRIKALESQLDIDFTIPHFQSSLNSPFLYQNLLVLL